MSKRKEKKELRRAEAEFGAVSLANYVPSSSFTAAKTSVPTIYTQPTIATKSTVPSIAPLAPKPIPLPTQTTQPLIVPKTSLSLPSITSAVAPASIPSPKIATAPIPMPVSEPAPVYAPTYTADVPAPERFIVPVKNPADRGIHPAAAYVPSGSSAAEPAPEQYSVMEPEPQQYSEQYTSNVPKIQSLAIVNTAPKSLGIIARILAFFGFVKASVPSQIAGDARVMSRSDAAGSLVRRSRAGDQNAMAIIDMARQNAEKGSIQAQLAVAAIKNYIKNNPVSGVSSDMAGEFSNDDSLASAVRLAHGPVLSNPHIRQAIAHFGAEEHEAFIFGMNNPGMQLPVIRSNSQRALKAGKIVGLARKFQAMSMRHIPVSHVDSAIGWELGE